jgi:hypothetical protein
MGLEGRGQWLRGQGSVLELALSSRLKRLLMFQRKFGNGVKVDRSRPLWIRCQNKFLRGWWIRDSLVCVSDQNRGIPLPPPIIGIITLAGNSP